jgi:succinoglycan biosynthesis protein ExoA
MNKPGILVSVIVPCRNERRFIEPAIRDILNQKGITEDWEILVADGDSDDGTWEILTQLSDSYPQLHVFHNPKRFVSHGMNRAVEMARGRFIVRMDVHTRYAEDYIAECLRVIGETGAQNVGGAARTIAEGPIQRTIAAAYASPFAVGPAKFHFPDYEGPVDTVTYGCWRRDYLLSIGGFDEDLVRNQDDELNLRIKRGGGVIWQSPRIKSWYYTRSSLRSLFKQYYQYGYWKVAVIRKHGQPASWRHLVPGGFLIGLSLLLIIGVFWLPALVAGGIVVSCYLLFLAAGSLYIAGSCGWGLLFRLPLTLATFHFSYGTGFMGGLFAFRDLAANEDVSTLSR